MLLVFSLISLEEYKTLSIEQLMEKINKHANSKKFTESIIRTDNDTLSPGQR